MRSPSCVLMRDAWLCVLSNRWRVCACVRARATTIHVEVPGEHRRGGTGNHLPALWARCLAWASVLLACLSLGPVVMSTLRRRDVSLSQARAGRGRMRRQARAARRSRGAEALPRHSHRGGRRDTNTRAGSAAPLADAVDRGADRRHARELEGARVALFRHRLCLLRCRGSGVRGQELEHGWGRRNAQGQGSSSERAGKSRSDVSVVCCWRAAARGELRTVALRARTWLYMRRMDSAANTVHEQVFLEKKQKKSPGSRGAMLSMRCR